jgi:enterochelin esterase-like enzyme
MKFYGKIALVALMTAGPIAASTQDLHLASGRVVRIDSFPSRFVKPRKVDVWLPDGYSSAKKYAVLYMHDGQMLFDSTGTWNHLEWRVDETAGRLMRENKVRDFIVVGIHNGGLLRHSEYFPEEPFESLSKTEQDSVMKAKRPEKKPVFYDTVQSDEYLKFIVTELKPYVDSMFSTSPDRGNTFIAGSSMGGLISLYAVCQYPEVFGGAACLSTHWTGIFTTVDNPIPAKFMKYLKKHLPDPASHKFYFDYGTEGLDAMYKPYQEQADRIMMRKGYTSANWITKEFPGENHSENAWAKRLELPLMFLLGN